MIVSIVMALMLGVMLFMLHGSIHGAFNDEPELPALDFSKLEPEDAIDMMAIGLGLWLLIINVTKFTVWHYGQSG